MTEGVFDPFGELGEAIAFNDDVAAKEASAQDGGSSVFFEGDGGWIAHGLGEEIAQAFRGQSGFGQPAPVQGDAGGGGAFAKQGLVVGCGGGCGVGWCVIHGVEHSVRCLLTSLGA